MSSAHTVLIVGAGPGDPELVTRAGWQALQQADVILYDALLDFEGFALANPAAQWIAVGKRAGQASTEQAFIGRLLVNLASQGKRVVRLKGGDPAIFGRLREELDALDAAGIGARVIPGVTAASASAASLRISLTERQTSRSVCFLTPTQAAHSATNTEWVEAALHADTAVLYMAARQRSAIAQTLIARGLSPDTPIALVENASGVGARQILSLGLVAHQKPQSFDGPVCMIIGAVVAQAHSAEHLPLAEHLLSQSHSHVG